MAEHHKDTPIRLSEMAAGPPAGTKLCAVADLAKDAGLDLVFNQDAKRTNIFLQRDPYDGLLYAYKNDCPHAHTPLNLGNDKFLDYTKSQILCRTHGARFRISDGVCVAGPCIGTRLTPVDFTIVDGTVYST